LVKGYLCGRHKDVTVVTDDYLLDDLERSQFSATHRRRSNRSRRYYRLVLISLGFLALLALAAPSIVSHTGIARSMLASRAQSYGWEASAESIDVGWITPLSIKGLDMVGPSGETLLQIDRADTSLTVMSLIGFDPATIGEVSLRGVKLACTVGEGQTSIESDLADMLEPSDEAESEIQATIQIQDVGATITDLVTGESWLLNQSNINLAIEGPRLSGDISGVVNEPSGGGGAIQSKFVWHADSVAATVDPTGWGEAAESSTLWELSIDTESFPLSVANLISRRFAGVISGLPQQFSGDTTGRLRLVGARRGSIKAILGDVQIRNLKTIASSAAAGQTAV